MILATLVLLIGSIAGVVVSQPDGGVATIGFLAGTVVSFLGLALNVVALLNHPGAVRNWLSGSYLDLDETGDSIAWTDWAPLWTRSVAIDDAHVRIVYKTLYGLVPVKVIERRREEFYRVALNVSESQGGNSYGPSTGGVPAGGDLVSFAIDVADVAITGSGPLRNGNGSAATSYTLSLVDRHANEYTVLTVSDGPWSNSGEVVAGRIRARLTELLGLDRSMLGSPLKHAVVNDSPSGPGTAAPEKPHKPEMACPNCHRRFALYVKACPGCKVALFQD